MELFVRWERSWRACRASVTESRTDLRGICEKAYDELEILIGGAATRYARQLLDGIEDFRGWRKRLIEGGEDPYDIEQLVGRIETILGVEVERSGTALRAMARRASVLEGSEIFELDDIGVDTPRFPSGIPRIDLQTGGGFYGTVAVGGPPKLGKSTLAVGCARACLDKGFKVGLFYPEMTKGQIKRRLYRAGFMDLSKEVLKERLLLAKVYKIDFASLEVLVESTVEDSDSQVVFVVDSLNTLAKATQRHANDYWNAHDKLTRYFLNLRGVSEGRIGCVLISEFNIRGHLKGEQMAYDVDMQIDLQPTERPEVCQIIIQAGRESHRAHMGLYEIDVDQGKFKHVSGDTEP